MTEQEYKTICQNIDALESLVKSGWFFETEPYIYLSRPNAHIFMTDAGYFDLQQDGRWLGKDLPAAELKTKLKELVE